MLEKGWALKSALNCFRVSLTPVADCISEVIGSQGSCIATYASFLRNAKGISDIKRIHTCIIRSGSEKDCTLGNLLVQLYGKCGALENAQWVFVHMHKRNLFSWTIMIRTFVENGEANLAHQFFQQMEQEGVFPNRVSFVCIVSAYTCLKNLAEGKRMHARIISAFEPDVVLGSALVNMYSKCGSVENSKCMFDKIPQQNVVSWNTLIAAYTQSGKCREGLQLFQRMHLEGVLPTRITFVTVLDACGNVPMLYEAKQAHACILGSDFDSDVVVLTALVNMYAKHGNLQEAKRVFEGMFEHNVFSWDAMIGAVAQLGQVEQVSALFQQMQLECVIPSRVTFITILGASARMKAGVLGRRMHALIAGCILQLDLKIGNAIINMYGKNGSLEDSLKVFSKMPCHNVISWNTLIAVSVQHGHSKEALQHFHQMLLEGVIADKVSYAIILSLCINQQALGHQMHAIIVACGFDLDKFLKISLVTMYGKNGNLEGAGRMFDGVDERDVVLWSTMISACALHGFGRKALYFYQQMQLEGVIPNKITLMSILDVCASQAALTECKRIHSCILDDESAVRNSLINVYSECGNLKEACNVFNRTAERDLVTWTAMIAGYARHGLGKEAHQLFEEMKVDVDPNNITFINILDACSHGGLVGESYYQFHSMSKDYHITPSLEHYNCIIDLLGRAGQLHEAEELINDLPYSSTAITWITLLSACRLHLDMELGERVAKRIFELEPASAVPYVLLSNIYSGQDE